MKTVKAKVRTAHTRSSDKPKAIRNLTAIFKSIFAFLISKLLLLDVIYEVEQAVPADAREAWMVRTVAPPDEDWLAHDVVLWHEAPIAAVG